MIFRELFHSGVKMANANAPALLTAFGAVGTVTTAVLVGKASFEAADKIHTDEMQRALGDDDLTKMEKAKLIWPLYIPAAITGASTIAAIILSHRISSKRAAALAAAYALSEGRLEEYQEKVKEKLGVKKEKDTRDEINQDRVNKTYDENQLIFDPMEGKVIIMDAYTGRYFWSSVEAVNKAVNDINYEVMMSMGNCVTLSQFYDLLDLEHVSTSDYFGWNSNEMCEIDWSTTTTPDGSKAVHVFEFVNQPVLNPGDHKSFR